MAENPELETSDDALNLSGQGCESDEMGTQKISVSDRTNSLQFSNLKSDSFTVDMERLTHLTDKDKTLNSRITLQRSLSRKGSPQRGSEKRIKNSSTGTDRDASSSSPRASLAGLNAPEKPVVVTVETMDRPTSPQVHHQITIVTGNIGTTTAEGRSTTKRLSFRRSPPSWTVDPRRILLFFATLSSMGTILLIYFTLSMGKLSWDDNALNW
ncbi:hypothetical protein U1Q18_008947 [Sarracenia purpurea var. burkii]